MDNFDTRKWFKKQYLEEAGIQEGIWKVGNKQGIQDFIDEVQNLQNKYWNIVGSDDVHNGLDRAMREAEELKAIAKD